MGMSAGEKRTVNASCPQNYAVETLAGKSAVFDVTAKALEVPGSVTIDDAFAQSLGVESLANLKQTVKEGWTTRKLANAVAPFLEAANSPDSQDGPNEDRRGRPVAKPSDLTLRRSRRPSGLVVHIFQNTL